MMEPLDESSLAPFRALPGPDGRPLLMQIVDTALASLPTSLSDLRRALDEGNAEALRAYSHRLKGGSGTYGAKLLSAYAKELEVAAAEGNLEAAPSLLQAVEAEAARVEKALQAIKA